MVFNFLWFCLTLSVLEKMKSEKKTLIFEIPIISQILTFKRITNSKFINMYIIKKIIEYSLTTFCESIVYSSGFQNICVWK